MWIWELDDCGVHTEYTVGCENHTEGKYKSYCRRVKTEGILSSLKSMLCYELLTILAQTAAELKNKSTIGIIQYDSDKATPF